MADSRSFLGLLLLCLGLLSPVVLSQFATAGWQECLPSEDFPYNVTTVPDDICPSPFVFVGTRDCSDDPTCTGPSGNCTQVYCSGDSDYCGSPVWQLTGDGVDPAMHDCIGFRSGQTCSVQCLPGYYPDPARLEVTCLPTGLWSESACFPDSASCPHPQFTINNLDDTAMDVCAGASVGDTCTMVCETGYSPSTPTIECLQAPLTGLAYWEGASCNSNFDLDLEGCYYFLPPYDYASCDRDNCCCVGSSSEIEDANSTDIWGPMRLSPGVPGIDPTNSFYFAIRHFDVEKCTPNRYNPDDDLNNENTFVTGTAVEIPANGVVFYDWPPYGLIYFTVGNFSDGSPYIDVEFLQFDTCANPTQRATKGECPTVAPTATPTEEIEDISILNRVYRATVGEEWLERPAPDASWPFSDTEWCNFQVGNNIEIQCDYNIDVGIPRVTVVRLSQNKLQGMMQRPAGDDVSLLSQLPYVHTVVLSGNLLEGPIPSWSQFGTANDFPSLTYLDMSFNPLSTTIPSSLSQLGTLEYLSISHSGLYGDTDAIGFRALFAMANLRELYLQKNFFTGPMLMSGVPGGSFGSAFTHIYLGRNFIGGTGIDIPDVFTAANFPNLVRLGLNDNRFTGTVPASIQTLSKISGSGQTVQVNMGYNDLDCPLTADYSGWFRDEDSWYYNNLICCTNFDTGANYDCCCGTSVPSDYATMTSTLTTLASEVSALDVGVRNLPDIQNLILGFYLAVYDVARTGGGIPRYRVSSVYNEDERYNISYAPPGGYGGPLNGAPHPPSFYS